MSFERASGILLHITSLPGEFGIGDLGPAAFAFCNQLADARQTYWQILPLGPTGYGDSPYQCFSAFAGNTLLISPEKLVEDGLIDEATLASKPDFSADRVDYGGVYEWKRDLLPRAYESFRDRDDLGGEFETFQKDNAFWLEDYALYRSLKTSQDHRPWNEWPDGQMARDPEALGEVRAQLADQIAEQ